MIIANPIFDSAFKLLMENERVAKFLIGTLIEETVESLQVRPQEFLHQRRPEESEDAKTGWSVMRMDFIAVIKTAEGHKKVLIEVQKAFNLSDVMRFRKYLSSQYRTYDKLDGAKKALPIITIFFLGFELPEWDGACLAVRRHLVDMVEKKEVGVKIEFVESLTHDSYLVQVPKIADKYQTKLDKLLSLFRQGLFMDEEQTVKDFPYELDDEDLKEMAAILHYVATDPVRKKELEDEQEAWRTMMAYIEEATAKLEKKHEAVKKALAKKEKEAEANRKQAEANKKEAEANKKEAEANKKEAEANKKEAEANKKALAEKEKEAEAHKIALEEKDKELAALRRLLDNNTKT